MFEILSYDFYDRKTILQWYEEKKEIDFNPIYQRDSQNLWNLEMKQSLIDSIINGFDLPKFYFHLVENNSKLNLTKKKYAIIDGKQRLTCIFDFIEGKFALNKEFIYFKDQQYNLREYKYNDILREYPQIAYKLQEYLLDVMYVVTDEQDKIEMFFSRLNSGKALNNSEKRNAIIGYLNTRINEIVRNHIFFRNKLRFKDTRGAYKDVLAKLILIELNRGFVNMDKKTLDALYENYREENTHINIVISEIISHLDVISKVFIDKDPLLNARASIPVYYWFLKNLNIYNADEVRAILLELEQERKTSITSNIEIIQYNKFQQKGTDKKLSMEYRFEFLIKWYNRFI